jgi:hypothetical protein
LKYITVLLSILLAVSTAKAQSSGTTYVSNVDKMITIHKIGILPVTDNVGGLYSRYVESKLSDLVKNSHRFDLGGIKDIDASLTLDDYETKPDLVKNIGKKNGIEALIAAKIVKRSKGVEITVDLFLSTDGELFAQETASSNRFGTKDVEDQTSDSYSKLIAKIPYKAMVLSREGNRVTLDIGTRDGIRENIVVTAEQIIALKRHPKFNFVLGTEKEILGKIKIVKADDTLSFGVVLQEKDRGVVGPDTKITGLDYVVYGDGSTTSLQPGPGDSFPKDSVSFGKHPKEWLPPKQPSIGKVGIALGLGSYHNALTAITAASGQQSWSSDVGIYPQLEIDGEIWITPQWYAGATISQGVLSMANPQSGSTPGDLGSNNSHFDFRGGYKFLLQDDFYGPQMNLHLGISKYSNFIDASTPITFTSVSYGGMYLGVGGSIPLNNERSYYFDVNLDRYLGPSFTETPVTSGANSDSSITTFNIGGSYKLTNQFWLKAHLDFEFYSTTFSGVGTRPNGDYGLNTSQSLITLFSGVDYMF